MRHVPLWFDRFPKSRRKAYPRLKGQVEAPVAILGGGLTGAACALSFALAGVEAVVLEADVVGGGITAGASGLVRQGFPRSFHEVASLYGLRRARALWNGMRRAGLDFAAALKRHGVACDLEETDLVTFAGAGSESAKLLKREYEARKEAGIESAWMTPSVVSRETALESAGALRTRSFTLDPYRACLGMLKEASARGTAVHERSAVRRIRVSKRHVEILTDAASVRAETVVIATGAPLADLRPLRRHLRAEQIYGVWTEPLSAAARRDTGRREAVLEPFSEAGRTIRWMREDRVLVHGGRQPALPSRARERALTQRTGQLMYELLLLYPAISGLQPAAAWDAVDYGTVDGLPFVGPHRRFPRHFFAVGGSRHGSGLAWLAARMAVRYAQGTPDKADEAFGFSRIL